MKRCAGIFCLLSLCVAGTVHARLFVTITRDFAEKAVAVIVLTGEETAWSRRFLTTLSGDLASSGYLKITLAQFAADPAQAKTSCSAGELFITGSGTRARMRFSVEDTADGQELWAKSVALDENDPDESAHIASDEIILGLTGRPGIARTSIVYVVRDTPRSFRLQRIRVSSGAVSALPSFPFMVSFPRAVPGRDELLLVSYKDGWPRLARLDLNTGALATFVDEPGLSACATVSRETGEVAAVSSRSGDPEIYLFDRSGHLLKRLTHSRGIDSSPSFSPDGKHLAFVSDREGGAQVFVMNRDGFQVRRISYLSGYCTSPVWSPDGELIAYVYRGSDGYGIAVYHVARGRTVRTIPGLNCEELSWAPDSRHIAYSTSTAPSRIFVVDIYSAERRQLSPASEDAISPAWVF